MSTICCRCGGPADRFRDVVRVVEMRVEVTCRRCAQPAAPVPVPAHIAMPHGPKRSGRSELIGLLAVLVAAGLGVALVLVVRARSSTPVTVDAAAPTPHDAGPRGDASAAAVDSNSNGTTPEGLTAVLEGRWTHALPGPFRELPVREGGRFGAYRARAEYKNRFCGQGHCGNDLGNQIGLPILAVRGGVIERVVRQPAEFEGKWVLIRHPGGLLSYYMHLDEVAPELVAGGPVAAGQMIGTLGRTGIKHAEAHLHFMISFDSNGKEMFVDPEPLMREAELIELERLPEWAKPKGRPR